MTAQLHTDEINPTIPQMLVADEGRQIMWAYVALLPHEQAEQYMVSSTGGISNKQWHDLPHYELTPEAIGHHIDHHQPPGIDDAPDAAPTCTKTQELLLFQANMQSMRKKGKRKNVVRQLTARKVHIAAM